MNLRVRRVTGVSASAILIVWSCRLVEMLRSRGSIADGGRWTMKEDEGFGWRVNSRFNYAQVKPEIFAGARTVAWPVPPLS